jgi:Ino eighty subunit 1
MTEIASPGSTIANSELGDQQTHASSPTRSDPRTSLQHVLDNPRDTPPVSRRQNEMTEDEEVRTPGGVVREPPSKPATSASRKRKEPPPGSAQNNSMYSGNKVKHLKKDDGEPLWRKDIQYEFLKAVFEDDKAVFTNSYEPQQIAKQTFADLYIDTMARSSKTSKILRDKLLTEHEPAKNMAMVCLLVNLGRMNTTLNCEWRSSSSP